MNRAAEERFPTAAALDEALARPGSAGELLVEGGAACLLCGGTDPLALGRCPACGGSAETADTLVFLRRAPGVSARRAAALRLETVLPELGSDAARAAASGERPVFRVSRAGVPRLMEAMKRRELAARPVPVAGAWGALPPKAWVLAGAAVTAGAVAGSLAMPMLLWTSPVVGTLVLLGARRDARTPLVAPPTRQAALPPALERAVVDALVTLPPGTARSLLADIVRTCGALFATLARAGDDRGWRRRSASWSRPPARRHWTWPTWTRTSRGSSGSGSGSSRARRSGSTRSRAASARATRWCSGCSRR